MRDKNFGLDEEEFLLLIEKLKQGDEKMFETIFLKHFEDCIKYLEINFGADYTDAYDSTMDTLLEFRRLILLDKVNYGNLRYLYTKMASQKLLKGKKKMERIDLKETMPEIKSTEAVFDELDLEILDKAWNKMGTDCKLLLKQFYYQKIQLSEIALNQDKTAGAIRKQKERCVNLLRNNFKIYLQL